MIQKTGLFSKLFDDSKKVEAQLNEYGSQGWKLVCEHEGDKYFRWVFMREVQ
jgi:ribulose bisphosphate carboxylase small subunit